MSEEVKPEVSPMLMIGVTNSNKIVVQGMINEKGFAISLLAEAIKIVLAHKPEKPAIVIPKPGEVKL